jgi:hypothetical protein
MEDKNLGGRPPLYNTPEELEAKIAEYFESVKPKTVDNPDGTVTTFFGEPVTISGLAFYLGFESRQSFYDQDKREGFSYLIKKYRLKVESEYEKSLQSKNPAGSIFALKNMGWKDTQEIKHEVQKSFFNLDPLADDSPNPSASEDSPT